MAHIIADLVKQYTSTTGTGAYTLGAAVTNFRTFGAVLSNGDTTTYKVEGTDSAGSAAWEIAIGTYTSSGTTMARTTLLSSSTGSAIDWGQGLKVMSLIDPAERSLYLSANASTLLLGGGTAPTNGQLFVGNGTGFVKAALTGTTNRVTVTNGSGTVTLSCPQDIHTGATPTFAGLSVSSGQEWPVQVTSASATAANRGSFALMRRSTSGGATADTSLLGGVSFSGHDGTSYHSGYDGGAEIYATAYGTWSGTNRGADLRFYTTALNSTSPALTMRLWDAGLVTFPRIGTTASAANAYLDAGATNNLLRSTSSLRYKKDREAIDIDLVRAAGPKLLEAAIWYRSLAPADRPEWSWYGLGAEEVAEIDPRLVHWTYLEDAYEDVVTGTVDEDVPVTEEFEESETEIVVDEGRAVLRSVTRTVHRQIVDMLPVVTEDGHPVTDGEGQPLYHSVPRVEKVTREVKERRLKDGAQMVPDGVQYERVALILCLYLADKIANP